MKYRHPPLLTRVFETVQPAESCHHHTTTGVPKLTNLMTKVLGKSELPALLQHYRLPNPPQGLPSILSRFTFRSFTLVSHS